MGRRALDMDNLVLDLTLTDNLEEKKKIAKKITPSWVSNIDSTSKLNPKIRIKNTGNKKRFFIAKYKREQSVSRSINKPGMPIAIADCRYWL